MKYFTIFLATLVLSACTVHVQPPESYMEAHIETIKAELAPLIQPAPIVMPAPEVTPEVIIEYVNVDRTCELPSLDKLLSIEPVNIQEYKAIDDQFGYVKAMIAYGKTVQDTLVDLERENNECKVHNENNSVY